MIDRTAADVRAVRNFGLLFALIGTGFGGYLWWMGSTIWYVPVLCAAFFAGAGITAPSLLRPLYTIWMVLARALGWLNTRVLLTLFFIIVITPVGVILRLMRKDLLEEGKDKNAVTYWKRRTDAGSDKSRYENLF